MEFNESAFNVVNDVAPQYLFKFVEIDQCREFVADVVLQNRLYLVLVLMTIAFSIYAVYKTGFLKKECRIIKKFSDNFKEGDEK